MQLDYTTRRDIAKKAAMKAVIEIGHVDFRLAQAVAHGIADDLTAALTAFDMAAATLRTALAEMNAPDDVEPTI